MSQLPIRRLVYELASDVPLPLHYDLPTITIRGAFGYALAHVIAHLPNIPEIQQQIELFKSIFMPQDLNPESAFDREQLRPFVIRGKFSSPDKTTFRCEAMLFGLAAQYESLFDTVFRTLAQGGLGEQKQVCSLRKISSEDIVITPGQTKPFLLVTFSTPCARLKSRGQVLKDEIPFAALFARLVDRTEELIRLYGKQPPLHDYDTIGRLKFLAQNIPWKKLSGGYVTVSRVSGRTGNYIKMNGFRGTMEYCGDFSPFMPYLDYLPFISLGHFSAFGCGWANTTFSDSEI